ncbi:MAG: hypothetical protein ACLKAN_13790 [Alkaliphilus sp.]
MSVFVEENNNYKIDFGKEINHIEINGYYAKLGGLLSDVDAIIELKDEVVFLEYKNSNIAGASNPESFDAKICSDKHYCKIARKYYDSFLYVNSADGMRGKTFKYYYIFESALADSVIRTRLAGKIKRKLPFDIQKKLPGLSRTLIDDFRILSIEEWNMLYADFKFKKIR